jgi:hypothetical protein
VSTDIEEALRAEMAARAETARPKPGFQAVVERGVRRDKARRRAAGAMALALLVGVGIAASTVRPAGMAATTAIPATQLALFPLLEIPTRGSLAGDSAFIADATRVGRTTLTTAVEHNGYGSLEPSTFRLLYAGDDGVLRYVVVAGIFAGPHVNDKQESNATAVYDALIGPSGASASELRSRSFSGSTRGEPTVGFVDGSAGPGKPTPLIVLGPTSMTDVRYSAGITLDGRLQAHRIGVPMTTVDGAAIGEIPGTSSATVAYGYATGTVFRAELNGRTTYELNTGSATPEWASDYLTSDPTTAAANQGLKDLLAQKASAAGMTLGAQDPLVMSIGMAVEELAAVEHVSVAQVHESVAWIGLAKPGTGAVVLDVTVPGLPPLQLFMDDTVGSGGGVGIEQGPLIRVAPDHGAHQVPQSRAQFTGGVAFGESMAAVGW